MSLFGKDREAPQDARPRIPTACTCGCEYMTAGGQTLTAWHDGAECGVVPAGAVLCCLSCGARWYTTPSGLAKPHTDALPPAWAVQDRQREAAAMRERQAADAPERDGKRRVTPRRPVEREFSRPPRVP